MTTIVLRRNRVTVVSHAFDRSGSEVPALPPGSSLNYLSARSHKHTQFGKRPLHTHIGLTNLDSGGFCTFMPSDVNFNIFIYTLLTLTNMNITKYIYLST